MYSAVCVSVKNCKNCIQYCYWLSIYPHLLLCKLDLPCFCRLIEIELAGLTQLCFSNTQNNCLIPNTAGVGGIGSLIGPPLNAEIKFYKLLWWNDWLHHGMIKSFQPIEFWEYYVWWIVLICSIHLLINAFNVSFIFEVLVTTTNWFYNGQHS